MEFGKAMDVSAFDWDDTALIKAYDRAMKTSTKKAYPKSKEKKTCNKENSSDENAVKPWEIGDYCRAVYQADGLLYEATIVAIHGNTCTIEFLGYGDLEEVALDSLIESCGKKARQKQRKRVMKAETGNNTCDTDYSEIIEGNRRVKPVLNQYQQNTADYHGASNTQYYQPPNPAPTFNHVLPHPLPTACGQARIGEVYPPPAPPMPHCSAVARDPALSAMLVSWYMAGYYTGLHQNHRSHQCPAPHKARCCDSHVPNCHDPCF